MELRDDANRIHLAALVPYSLDTTPSQRFRIEQWRPVLEEAGIGVAFFPFADESLTHLLQQPGRTIRKILLTSRALSRRWRLAASLERGRPLFLHRGACLLGPPLFERVLSRRHPLIYDFDDAIYLLHTAAVNPIAKWLKRPGNTETICRLSHHVVVGNRHLASWARAHGAPRVTVVPSSIDTARYRPRRAGSVIHKIVVGWSGTSTSQTYLEAFAPMLRRVVSTHDVELRVLSNREPHLPGISYAWRRWSADTEVEEIASFDIGIMPMPDESWALGKGAFKALQYMALAVPTVASPVGANRELIEHGRNGLLAGDTRQWLEAVRILVRDPNLRRRLGEAGRRTVEEGYSKERSAVALAAVVRDVVRKAEVAA